jgi:hypothetical protein
MTFFERQNGPHIYEMLPRMNPNIAMHFIYSSKDATAYVVLSFHCRFRGLNMVMLLEPEAQCLQHTRHGDVL